MITVSKAQLQRAEDALRKALDAAYGPMDVNGEQLCWDGRIHRAATMANDLISSGKLTKEKVESIIDGFQAEQRKALAAVGTAHDEYVKLCKQASITPKLPERPQCPCSTCADTLRYQAAESLQTAIAAMLEEFNDATVKAVGAWRDSCAALGVKVQLDFGYSKIVF